MRRYTMGNTVYINEGTTKYVNFYTFTPSGAADDLTGYSAKVYIEKLSRIKSGTTKECAIEGNCISFKLSPEDTKGAKQGRFEVQVTNGIDFYSLQGLIVVKKSVVDYVPSVPDVDIDVSIDGGEL